MPAEKPKTKSSKPLMEKRRRARINDSLMQLKTLVLDALNKNNSRHSKLEKADILEMTVRYLRTIQRQQISASVSADPAVLGQYRSGYAQCVNEVTRYLNANANTTDGAAPELRTRLVGHLADLCTSGQQQHQAARVSTPSMPQQQRSPVAFQIAQTPYQQQQQQTRTDAPVEGAMLMPSMQVITQVQQSPITSVPVQRISPKPEGARTEYSLTTPVYNTTPRGQLLSPTTVRAQSPMNSAQVVQSVPVGVTSSLPSGDITLVLSQQALPNGQVPTHLIPVYAPAGSTAVLSPTSTANTNIQSANPNACHVSLSSPRAAATVPSTVSPTSPQSSMTIPAQHAQVTQPPSTSAQVAYCVPVQTKLSPVREYSYQRIEPAREQNAPTVEQCAAKSDPMWRPW